MADVEKFRNCYSCIHFFPLTKIEKKELMLYAGSGKNDVAICKGVCMGADLYPNQLIQRVIVGAVSGCSAFHYGYCYEFLPILCPECNIGTIVISHFVINRVPEIIFWCDDYPKCKAIFNTIELNRKCRFCGSPLKLSCGDILQVSCSGCGRVVMLPVSMNIYPALAMPGGGCVHTGDFRYCKSCNASRQQRKSLIELEFPLLFKSSNRSSPFIAKSPSKYISNNNSSRKIRSSYFTYGNVEDIHNSDYFEEHSGYLPYGHRDVDRDDFNEDWWLLTDEERGGNSFY